MALKVEPAGAALDSRTIISAGHRADRRRAWWAWFSGSAARRRQPTVDRMAIQKEASIDQIAALDDEFAEGQVDEINYKAKAREVER